MKAFIVSNIVLQSDFYKIETKSSQSYNLYIYIRLLKSLRKYKYESFVA